MHDVIVVGARCTGAPAAMLLAQRGHRVLLVDKDPPGSDMTHSTHFVQPVAVSKLRKWGLLPALEAVCSAFETYSLDFGVAKVLGTPPAIDGDARAFCPRRTVLDPILVAAAVAAGVEYRPDTKVLDVVIDNGVARGVTVASAAGRSTFLPARLVIGADGPGSTVARAVGAEHYHEAPAQQATMWGYWDGIALGHLDFTLRRGRAIYAGPTSDGETLIGVNWVIDDFKAKRKNLEADYHATISTLNPQLAARMRPARLSTPLRLGSTRNFLRKPWGPGWVLLGDAGHKKDPCTAQGITDAFIDVETCVPIIDEGLRGARPIEPALAVWHQTRDARLVPLHEMAIQMAKMEAPSEQEAVLYKALENDPEATTAWLGVFIGHADPRSFFAPGNIQKIVNGSKANNGTRSDLAAE